MELGLDALTPQAREAVERLARETGTSVAHALSVLVLRGAGLGASDSDASPEEQDAAWREFLAATADWSKELPKGAIVDDSRESNYSGRGE